MKQCKVCKKDKSEVDFHKGNRSTCKPCAIAIATQWAKDNKDRVNVKNRKWRADNIDKARDIERNYRRNNRSKERLRWDMWKENNPEKYKASRQAWRSKRRSLEFSVSGETSREEIQNLNSEYCNLCVYCLEPATQIDHVVPLNSGGLNVIENLVPCCLKCNCSKQDTPLLVWLSWR